MDEITINLYPIFQSVLILFAVVGFYFVIITAINTFGRGYKDKLDLQKDIHFKDKDVEVVTDAFAKIGEVKNGTENEVILNKQNVENNKEIHEANKRFDEQDKRIDKLEETQCKILDMLERLQIKE